MTTRLSHRLPPPIRQLPESVSCGGLLRPPQPELHPIMQTPVVGARTNFQVVPAAYIVMRRGEQVLLQLRANTGYMDDHWAMAAAGHVEADESVYDAAVREAREELGVMIGAPDLTPLCAMHRTHGNHHWIDERVDFFFSCTRWSGEPRLLETDKAADLQWFGLDALPQPVVPHELAVLQGLLRRDLQPVMTFGF